MRKTIMLPFLLIAASSSAASNESNVAVNINSYEDAASYINTAFYMGSKKNCWDLDYEKNKVEDFFGSAQLAKYNKTEFYNKTIELKSYSCDVLSSIIDMVGGNKNAILKKYPLTQKAEPITVNNKSDWKKLPTNNPVFYTQNGFSKVALTINNMGNNEITLFTVNSSCGPNTKRDRISGVSYMYANKVLIKFSYICNGDKQSMFFAESHKGKGYISSEFQRKNEVCYGLNREIKGLCFSAVGFNKAKSKLSEIQDERSSAL